MREIPLTNGMATLVDDEDYSILSQFKWHMERASDRAAPYAATMFRDQQGRYRRLRLHQFLCAHDPGQEIDHIDTNTLNNCKSNLRPCSHLENGHNRRKQANNTSGFKGVHWHCRARKYVAKIKYKGKWYWLGCFSDPVQGAHAYNEAALKYYGVFARLNAIPE